MHLKDVTEPAATLRLVHTEDGDRNEDSMKRAAKLTKIQGLCAARNGALMTRMVWSADQKFQLKAEREGDSTTFHKSSETPQDPLDACAVWVNPNHALFHPLHISEPELPPPLSMKPKVIWNIDDLTHIRRAWYFLDDPVGPVHWWTRASSSDLGYSEKFISTTKKAINKVNTKWDEWQEARRAKQETKPSEDWREVVMENASILRTMWNKGTTTEGKLGNWMDVQLAVNFDHLYDHLTTRSSSRTPVPCVQSGEPESLVSHSLDKTIIECSVYIAFAGYWLSEMLNPVVIFVELHIQSEEEDEKKEGKQEGTKSRKEKLLAALEANKKGSDQEEGCLWFEIQEKDDDHYLLYEAYADEDAVTKHKDTEHCKLAHAIADPSPHILP